MVVSQYPQSGQGVYPGRQSVSPGRQLVPPELERSKP
ncbi:hypothetical protein lerEdw1_014691, partial [Lerista edwardsae]